MQELYDRTFARLDRVAGKRQEISHGCTEIYVAQHRANWLAALRASLDNAIYALASAITGQNPPPQAERIQYPICPTPAEFARQAKRLAMLPPHIIEALEKAQPYQSPWNWWSGVSRPAGHFGHARSR